MTTDTSKIHQEHLERHAYVYVRQSSLRQVENNLESQRRQYAFAERAIELGWSSKQVVVIDEDQGKSGSRAHQRSGFGRLVTAVGSGQVGIVMMPGSVTPGAQQSRLAQPDVHESLHDHADCRRARCL
jgi:DNA invertase Pin-like site-specific DNA recombinase